MPKEENSLREIILTDDLEGSEGPRTDSHQVDEEHEEEYKKILEDATQEEMQEIADILGVTYQVCIYAQTKKLSFLDRGSELLRHTPAVL